MAGKGSGRSWERGVSALQVSFSAHPEPDCFNVLHKVIFFLFF